MLDFFKRKKEKPQEQTEKKALTEQELDRLKQLVEGKANEISRITDKDSESREVLAELYEEQGLVLAEMEQLDEAIAALERSLELKLSIGDGYKKLMSLYNAKRAAAARSGDDAGIETYMQKMDDMRQIAKQVTITG
ncbi:tetratricopeptide repeat protein [Enterococcus sp. LJL51]|uniref:tetratricopeptide repeat protein n=1 Tax=Enterococcus sp. LJL51 TaxID=3416656 RepID=UPI003CEA2A14